ncbi:hypothetical protein QOT17_019289 [Balamuthia mandrillaris]
MHLLATGASPLPEVWHTSINEQLEEWYRHKVIVDGPMDSLWNSSILCVPKKDANGNLYRVEAMLSTLLNATILLQSKSFLLWSLPSTSSAVGYHKALSYLFTAKHSSFMLNHWEFLLLQFYFNIVHQPGVQMGLENALSCYLSNFWEEGGLALPVVPNKIKTLALVKKHINISRVPFLSMLDTSQHPPVAVSRELIHYIKLFLDKMAPFSVEEQQELLSCLHLAANLFNKVWNEGFFWLLANGAAEAHIKLAKSTLMKLVSSNWSHCSFLDPPVNLPSDFSNLESDLFPKADCLAQIAKLHSVVWPADATVLYNQIVSVMHDSSVSLVEFKPGDTVMLHHSTATSKINPKYLGPFFVKCRAKSGAYILVDVTSNELEDDQLESQAIPDGSDDDNDDDDDSSKSYEVSKVLDHCGPANR